MIVGIWLFMIVCLVIFIGEVRYRTFVFHKKNQSKMIINGIWEDNVDTELKELSMEHIECGFVSSVDLSRRGSWRVAQNQIIGLETFEEMRSIEYSKMI